MNGRYEVGYTKLIHGNWCLQYVKALETDDLETARAEIRKQTKIGNTRGLLMYDKVEKIFSVQPNSEDDFD
jgi:hypothetical protein